MNSNINRLALEAGGSHYPEVNTKQLESFAELIVKECIQQLENSIHADPYTGETYDNNEVNAILIDNIDNLKEHFGVQ